MNRGYRQDRLDKSRGLIGHGSLKNGSFFFGLFLHQLGTWSGLDKDSVHVIT